ncbi:MAG: DUF3025 domain-containing protein [Thiobacillaceae bacterium]|nr:DUF3025 domain-containing protein [Thiobacillaceae bacterium]
MKLQHSAFDPYRTLIELLGLERGFPAVAALSAAADRLGIVNAHGKPLSFIAPDSRMSARDYETGILLNGCVPTRPDNVHDLMNALVWLRFPRFKATLNERHVAAIAAEPGTQRGRRRDALTVLDESGIWVASVAGDLALALRRREWEQLFWDRRDEVGSRMCFVVVGHALLEKVLTPYPSMTGKCLLLESANLDLQAAEHGAVAALADLDDPRLLPPLPLLGIPGWDDNASAAYYRNSEIFRPLQPSCR